MTCSESGDWQQHQWDLPKQMECTKLGVTYAGPCPHHLLVNLLIITVKTVIEISVKSNCDEMLASKFSYISIRPFFMVQSHRFQMNLEGFLPTALFKTNAKASLHNSNLFLRSNLSVMAVQTLNHK